MLIGAFGDNVGVISANNYKMNTKRTDGEDIQLSWMLPHVNRRVLVASEVKKGVILDGNILKPLHSGGDPQQMRPQHGLVRNCVVQGTPIFFVNSMPDIEPFDEGMRNRLRTIELDCTFVENPDPKKGERKANPLIKERFKHDAMHQDAAMHLLLDAYHAFKKGEIGHTEPPGMAAATQDNVAEGVDFRSRLVKYFDLMPELTKRFVSGKEIIDLLDKAYHGPGMTKMKPGDLKRCMMEIGIKESKNCGPNRTLNGYPGVVRNTEPEPM
jgi:hypothetical protein